MVVYPELVRGRGKGLLQALDIRAHDPRACEMNFSNYRVYRGTLADFEVCSTRSQLVSTGRGRDDERSGFPVRATKRQASTQPVGDCDLVSAQMLAMQ